MAEKKTEKKSKPKAPKKNGRPKKEVDLGLAERLAQIMCTQEEIASVLKVSVDTLSRTPGFADVYKSGRESGKASLRRLQWKHAQNNPAMAIWLGKQYLGQTDRAEEVGGQERVTVVSDVPKEG